ADGHESHVSVRARDVELLDVAPTAIELLAIVDHPLQEVAGKELRHRDLAGCFLLAVEQIASMVREPARGFDRSEMLDELVLPHLTRPDRTAEGLAIVRIGDGLLPDVLSARYGDDRRGQALALKVAHDVIETVAFLPEAVFQGNPAVLEEELGGVGGVVADF